MNFAFSPEQDAVRAEARRFLAERVDVRAQIEMPGAHDPTLWKEMAALGWLGLNVPQGYGGAGASLVDSCILLEETGRALLPGPFLTSVAAAWVLNELGTEEQRAQLLPRIATGEDIASVTVQKDARMSGDALDGGGAVPDADLASWIIVFLPEARCGVIAPRSAYASERREAADLTRALYTVRYDGRTPVQALADHDFRRVWPRLIAIFAAQMVGAAAGALEMAVAYAKQREQFGAPIGSFQAIKHKCADMLRSVEAARLAVYYAAWAIDSGAPDASVATSTAKALASDALTLCAAENIQIHGGIGVTWWHPAHLYYRRALMDQVWFGDATAHRDRAAQALLDGTAFPERA